MKKGFSASDVAAITSRPGYAVDGEKPRPPPPEIALVDKATIVVKKKPLLENQWERDYWEVLRDEAFHRKIKWAKPKGIVLPIASGIYKPDFIVWPESGKMEVHEVKGFHRSRDIARFKTAIMEHPWLTFILVKKTGGKWTREVFRAPAE